MMGETFNLCRDEDCPVCEWPETFVEVVTDEMTGAPIARAFGCRKCGWRKEGS